MATISITFDSCADVTLTLESKDDYSSDRTDEQASVSDTQETSTKYSLGPLSIKVKEFHLRVSSSKLVSSSLVFRAMLGETNFHEGKELKEHGSLEITLTDPEDEPTAMMIVLGILHEEDVEMPAEIDLPTLNNVAVLVDKYQWHELLAPHARSWFNRLVETQGLPDGFNETLLTWLWIAWLFGIEDHFKTLSRVAQQSAPWSFDLVDESIRLPTRVLKAINKRRGDAFKAIEQAIKTFEERLLDPTGRENDNTQERKMLRCMVLGHAKTCSKDLEVGEFATPDHASISIRLLKTRIDLIDSTANFSVTSPERDSMIVISEGSWDLKYFLQKVIKGLEMDDWGLDYADFKPVSTKP